MKRVISFHDMSLTFQNAVAVTRKLDYQYLWIDSFCIIQNSEIDWQIEAVCMQRYYREAEMIINTDLIAGDHEGFFDYIRKLEHYVEIFFMISSLKEPAYARVRKSMKNHIHRKKNYLTIRI